MTELKTNNPLALQFLMTDDLYRIHCQTEQKTFKPGNELLGLSFDYLGENNKYILILLNDPDEIINTEDLKTLQTILEARQLELRDVAVVNLLKHPSADFKYLKQFFSFQKLILFGINPVQIGLKEAESNQILLFQETRILATYSFDEMRNNNTRKRLFWNAMKEL